MPLKDILRTFLQLVAFPLRYLKSSPCIGIKKPAQEAALTGALADDELCKECGIGRWRSAIHMERSFHASYPHGTAARGNRRAALELDRRRSGDLSGRDHEKRACFENPSFGVMARRIIDGTPRHSLASFFPRRGHTQLRPFNGFRREQGILLDKCGVENFHAPRPAAHVRDEYGAPGRAPGSH